MKSYFLHTGLLFLILLTSCKMEEKKDYVNKDNVFTLNNQVKSNKSEILVLNQMIE